MKKRLLALLTAGVLATACLAGCGNSADETKADESPSAVENTDQEAADNVAALIDAIYVQERTDATDQQCTDAKAAWDALTDAQKELVEGENADPDYFGRDTGFHPKNGSLPLHSSYPLPPNWQNLHLHPDSLALIFSENVPI